METAWITSKEVMRRAGVSRATLNNYIRYGILPRPVVRSPMNRSDGPTKIGYFPRWVVERIMAVKEMKRGGNTMEDIARSLGRDAGGTKSFSVVDGNLRPFPSARKETSSETGAAGRALERMCLDVEGLDCAAYFINQDFEIEWINESAEQELFNHKVSSIAGIEDRNIFKRLFDWEFHESVENWQDMIVFHMDFIRRATQRTAVGKLYQGMTVGEKDCLERAYDESTEVSEKGVVERSLKLRRRSGEELNYSVYTVFFREGLFFVYDLDRSGFHGLKAILSRRGDLIQELLTHRMPSLLSLCVLVADLQDSMRISVELPPSEYFELINSLWRNMAEIFDSHNGICGKHAGDGLLYYFVKKPGNNYIMDALNCALKVRERVKDFSNQWQSRKGWFNELSMNIGLDEGKEFFGTIQSAYNLEFAALGDSINHAARLSDLARHGAVFATKNLINKLDYEEQKSVRYGIKRRHPEKGEVFIENSFSRVIDVLDPGRAGRDKFLDIGTLPITEIISID